MKDVVLNEIKKGLKEEGKWYCRIVIDIFSDLFYYAYRKGMVDYFNCSNK